MCKKCYEGNQFVTLMKTKSGVVLWYKLHTQRPSLPLPSYKGKKHDIVQCCLKKYSNSQPHFHSKPIDIGGFSGKSITILCQMEKTKPHKEEFWLFHILHA